MALFDGFTTQVIDLPTGALRLSHGGKGPPLICLHGNPQTHQMWHSVAPVLAQDFTVYCPDLRGYGGSHKPDHTPDHAPYSKRKMAQDVLGLMDHFGHEQAIVVAHDRGARVAHRLCLDHPDRVSRLCLMDIVPTIEHFERTDMRFAMAYYHWFFLAQPRPVPEDMIANDPAGWFQAHTQQGTRVEGGFHPEAQADYLAALQDPGTIRGICEDYRAAATIDLEHDRQSRAAGDQIQCPTLVLWGTKGIIGKLYDPLDLWGRYVAGPLTGQEVNSGHYLPEEAPTEVLQALEQFLP